MESNFTGYTMKTVISASLYYSDGKSFTSATSNLYRAHFYVGRQLIFVTQTAIFDFFGNV